MQTVSFSGRWRDPPPAPSKATATASNPSPVFARFAELNGLSILVTRAISRNASHLTKSMSSKSAVSSSRLTKLASSGEDTSAGNEGGEEAIGGLGASNATNAVAGGGSASVVSVAGGANAGFPPSITAVNPSATVAATSTLSSSGVKRENLLAWLRGLDTEFEIEGVTQAFAQDSFAVTTLLRAAGAVAGFPSSGTNAESSLSLKSMAKTDAQTISIWILTSIFSEHSAAKQQQKVAVTALRNGVLDRVLFRLGELQSETPSRPARYARFRRDGSDYPGYAGIASKEDTLSVPSLVSKSIDASAQTGAVQSSVTPPLQLVSSAASGGTSTHSSSPQPPAKALWKPSYGFGEASSTTVKSEAQCESQIKSKLKRSTLTLNCISAFLERAEKEALEEEEIRDLIDALDSSCLYKVIFASFFQVTAKALSDSCELYTALFRVVASMGALPAVGRELFFKDSSASSAAPRSICALIQHAASVAKDDLEDFDENESPESIKIREIKLAAEHALAALRRCQPIVESTSVTASFSSASTTQAPLPSSATAEATDGSAAYIQALRPELFKDRDMRDGGTAAASGAASSTSATYESHYFAAQIIEDMKLKVSKTRLRHFSRELKSLKSLLPLDFGSSILVRVDKSRPFVLQALIFGPTKTPYDSGGFLFDIFIPSEYPQEPPKINFCTTGGGKWRANPNLYATGKVCLSLLGTWRGGATGSENWDPERSSLFQVLVSIQSAILGSEYPYFNEPGVETQWGTQEGTLQARINANGGYERVRSGTLQHAMIAHIKRPPFGFEEAIRLHFLLKRQHIRDHVIKPWLEDAEKSDTKGHSKALKELCGVLEGLLADLGPETASEVAALEASRADGNEQGVSPGESSAAASKKSE